MEYPKIYCLRCKKHTDNNSVEQVSTTNNRQMLKAKCPECGANKNRFITGLASKSSGSLLTNKLADDYKTIS